MSLKSDNFDDGIKDAQWDLVTDGGQAIEQDGKLLLPCLSGQQAGYVSKDPTSLIGLDVSVDVVVGLSGGLGLRACCEKVTSGNLGAVPDYISISLDATPGYCYVAHRKGYNLVDFPYAGPRLSGSTRLRIWFDEATNTIRIYEGSVERAAIPFDLSKSDGYVYLTGANGTQTVDNFTVGMPAPPPLQATASPSTQTVQVNQNAIFNVAASGGTAPYIYQWYSDSTPLPNQTGASINITSSIAQTLSLFCRVTDSIGISVDTNVVTVTFTSAPLPPNIWDRCESLSDAVSERFWGVNRAEAAISIDPSVKSSIGTGSIKCVEPATSGVWNVYVVEGFGPVYAATLKDFNQLRPKSVYIQCDKALTFAVEIVTREPDGTAWNTHQVAEVQVPANTMTEIPFNYSGIPAAALQMVVQVSVIARVNQTAATFYIAGLSAEVLVQECSIDADCVAKYGSGYICQNGICILVPPPPPPPTHALIVNSMPIQGVPFMIEKVA